MKDVRDVVILKAKAKINLFLEVTGRNAISGYHELHSLMLPLELHDEIRVKRAGELSVRFAKDSMFFVDVPQEGNVVYKVARLLQARYGVNVDYEFEIVKNIPSAAGLGGGSSDAAVVLKFLIKKNRLAVTTEDLISLALQIGADVPFFLESRPQICQGFGEVMSDLQFSMPTNLYVLIVRPNVDVLTAKVFTNFHKQNIEYTDYRPVLSFREAVLRKNDLLECAILESEEIAKTLAVLQKLHGCIKYAMSGSGSSCFALFESQADADRAMESIGPDLATNSFVCLTRIVQLASAK